MDIYVSIKSTRKCVFTCVQMATHQIILLQNIPPKSTICLQNVLELIFNVAGEGTFSVVTLH